jgi:hypothetical protein
VCQKQVRKEGNLSGMSLIPLQQSIMDIRLYDISTLPTLLVVSLE